MLDNRDAELIQRAIDGIKQARAAGFGEVVVNVADHYVVDVKCTAQYQMRNKKGEG